MGNTQTQARPPLLGDKFMDFEADTTHGQIKWHEYINGKWAILFSHPADYTPVCTTELGMVSKYFEQFRSRDCVMAALSCDPVESHKGWVKDVIASQGLKGDDLPFPIIADPNRKLAKALGMLDPVAKDAAGLPLTARAVFVINPDKKLALSILYPATTGRNFDELVRVIDSLQLTAKKKVATPANWKNGDKCMVLPSIPDEEVKTLFPKGCDKIEVPSGKNYLRMTPDPTEAAAPAQS